MVAHRCLLPGLRFVGWSLRRGVLGQGRGFICTTQLSVNKGESLGGATLANLIARRCFVDPSCFSVQSSVLSVECLMIRVQGLGSRG